MKRTLRSLCIILVIASVGQIGCSHTPKKPNVLSDDLRGKLGTIGVVSGRYEPNILLRKPLDKTEGASATAKSYTAAWIGAGSGSSGAILLPLTLPIPILLGAILGSSKGLSDEKMKEVKDAEASIRAAVAGLKIQDNLRDEFLEIARERTSFPFVCLGAEGPHSPDERVSYRSLYGRGVDSILEIGVTDINLNGLEPRADFSLDHIDPLLWISIGVRVRLVRTVYDGEIYTQSFQTRCPGPTFRFMEWGANDAQFLRKEVTGCLSSVRQRILRDLFNPSFDLTGHWISLIQSCNEQFASQCQIYGRFVVGNIGNLDAPVSSVKFYLSEGPEFEEGRSTLLERVPAATIGVSKGRIVTLSYDLKDWQDVRGKYVIAVIDAEGKVPEPDRANNFVVTAIK